jgi:hypothetical protein
MHAAGVFVFGSW